MPRAQVREPDERQEREVAMPKPSEGPCSCEEAEMLRALLKRWMACYDNGDPMGTIYGDTDEALNAVRSPECWCKRHPDPRGGPKGFTAHSAMGCGVDEATAAGTGGRAPWLPC